ncbi:MAG: outer membrane beta-barrel protein [Deltaproteobacteria bacterium]|nr:outer membrane beta-barrel protein [Deltaproteobacteria bacterium]
MAAESNFNHYGANFRGYRFTLDAGHVFFNRIHARAQGWYQISDYHDYEWFTSSGRVNDRLDRTYDVSGSLAYLFTDRLALAFTAGRQERMSNLDGFDYENNYMILNLDLNYDISGRGGYTEEVLYY